MIGWGPFGKCCAFVDAIWLFKPSSDCGMLGPFQQLFGGIPPIGKFPKFLFLFFNSLKTILKHLLVLCLIYKLLVRHEPIWMHCHAHLWRKLWRSAIEGWKIKWGSRWGRSWWILLLLSHLAVHIGREIGPVNEEKILKLFKKKKTHGICPGKNGGLNCWLGSIPGGKNGIIGGAPGGPQNPSPCICMNAGGPPIDGCEPPNWGCGWEVGEMLLLSDALKWDNDFSISCNFRIFSCL